MGRVYSAAQFPYMIGMRPTEALNRSQLLRSGAVHPASAIAESRVETALRDAGLSERISACMAGRMVDRLTISQLQRLEELGRPSATERESSIADYLERVSRVGDAEVVTVTATSAALCQTGLAR